MSEPPQASDRVLLSEAVSIIASDQEILLGRDTIRSRASRLLLSCWAEQYEEVRPKHYEELWDAAYKQALASAHGDNLAAAIMMQGWQLPPDAEWETVCGREVPVPVSFWAMAPSHDVVWTTSSFYGRRSDFDGYEQNWNGLFLRRSDVEALPRFGSREQPELATAAEKPSLRANSAWSHAEMTAAIARCSERNRETAWLIHFKPKRHIHGWNLTAFRQIWSEARETKGMAGRPPERAG